MIDSVTCCRYRTVPYMEPEDRYRTAGIMIVTLLDCPSARLFGSTIITRFTYRYFSVAFFLFHFKHLDPVKVDAVCLLESILIRP